ncbi:MAG: GNAT family N-acetyltransferase [Myxococcales bacterium]|nr:GNAT family N-acetyltransferase [Myxococcales bacterium]MBP6847282.1 GNAT family N-acetyltransferase [Kofleriaceae bacterium]
MGATIDALTADDLQAARAVLAEACRFDRAAEVAEEKLFGPSPHGHPMALAARLGGAVVGVAAACCDRVRVLAVATAARGRGVGSALLAACEQHVWAGAHRRVRVLDEPGNYLAPGVDLDNHETIAWLGRRGYVRRDEHENLVVDLIDNPRVSPARAAELADGCAARGYTIRRACLDELEAISAHVSIGFGGAWPFEIERAATRAPCGLFVAERDGRVAAFAAHDGNNRGLGWFGPAGTWPEHRGQGLGEALLIACLVDVAATHARSEIAWIGPREFYQRALGPMTTRRFAVLTRDAPHRRATLPPAMR